MNFLRWQGKKSMQKLATFWYTSNEQSEPEIKTVPLLWEMK
jgi:hypothetical protein